MPPFFPAPPYVRVYASSVANPNTNADAGEIASPNLSSPDPVIQQQEYWVMYSWKQGFKISVQDSRSGTGQAWRIKRRRDEEQRIKSARGREKSSDDIFVCERVCTSKRMLKKVGAFSKDPIPDTCVTVCGVSELDACSDACARTVLHIKSNMTPFNFGVAVNWMSDLDSVGLDSWIEWSNLHH
ncbi:hypothetical protein Cgig2_020024 [Carnegiea gigantea]|uniref:Uncharacterized protein n=1 Tax=Carnegiea gigantea TaxID=171969 RepID=A0A9Q1KDK3_9CARY|nr:hypothetical protein Cgig2_020024 [Carnegiea gigantea]